MKKRTFIPVVISLVLVWGLSFAKESRKESDLRLDTDFGDFHLSLRQPVPDEGPAERSDGEDGIAGIETERSSVADASPVTAGKKGKSAKDGVKNRPKKRWGRAWLELLPMITVSQSNYWIKYSKWIEDWQFKFTWKDQKKRFFSLQALKFDSNDFQTNWTHALAGAIYYNFARSNNLTWAESFLFNTATSFYWEFLVEWREVVSVNDNIWTAIGGVPIGEALFQTSRFLSRRPGLLNKIIATLLDPILAFNQWLDRKKGILPAVRPDEAHRFKLTVGQRQTSLSGDDAAVHTHLGIDSEIIHIPGYGRAGSFKRSLKDTLSTRMHLDMTLSRQGIEEMYMFTRVLLTGLAGQRLTPQEGGDGLRGYSYFLGAGSGFELFKKRSVWEYDSGTYFFYADEYHQIPLPTRFTDKFSVINVAGPVFDLALWTPKSGFRLTLQAYFDFAMVNASALNTYTRVYDLVDAKATLANYGYYYGWGYNASADFAYRYGNAEVFGGVKYRYYDSIEGIDRFQDKIGDDYNLKDSRLEYRAGLGYRLPRTPVELLFTFEEILRRGWIRDISHREIDTRLYAQIQLNL